MLQRFPIELIAWLGGLIFLAVTTAGTGHSSICPLDTLGFGWCPGCGLGRSIRSLMHGDLVQSFHHHWFGIPALLILLHRIKVLFCRLLCNFNGVIKLKYGERSSH